MSWNFKRASCGASCDERARAGALWPREESFWWSVAGFGLTHGISRAFSASRNPEPFLTMARICSIRGTRVRSGGKIHRSGLAKKKGGIGRHVTKVTKRTVSPNLQNKRIWVPELSKFVRVKLSCRALKTINKNGAFVTLKKAGLV
jgi:large subunit ribosomal protein L28